MSEISYAKDFRITKKRISTYRIPHTKSGSKLQTEFMLKFNSHWTQYRVFQSHDPTGVQFFIMKDGQRVYVRESDLPGKESGNE
jgi:hypothetical protein